MTEEPAYPLVQELRPAPDPAAAFAAFADRPHCLFFDSAWRKEALGAYSFVAADPFEWIAAPADGSDGLARLAEAIAPFDAPRRQDLPPFQGGAAGVLGYELARSLECVPSAKFDEFALPALAVGLYDVVVAFDHPQDRCWVISTGHPAKGDARLARAEARLREAVARLSRPAPALSSSPPEQVVPAERLAPQHAMPNRPGVTSDLSSADYLNRVSRAVEHIHAGDVFQVNFSQRLLKPHAEPSAATYLALRDRNPAPFAGYFDLGAAQVISASPERFVSVRGDGVETRPIKGTRTRSSDPVEDRRLADELVACAKDRAENVMIVDLMRNDLSRVCTPQSVEVATLCGLESYRHVHHLVSVVRGRLESGNSAVDLLRAAFPGGSITGAPKVRAMEIISQLEPTARGPYCGSLFYLGFNGDLDSSILIRTLVAAKGWLQASVGGGVVADSTPEAEYEESWHKAAGLF